MNSLNLAFVGDAVHTLFIRSHFSGLDITSNKLHKLCSSYCRASAQSKTLDRITPLLSDEEKEVVRKARNAKTHEAPKSASLVEYKKATCYEALIGYLYIIKNEERLKEILNYSLEELTEI